MENVSDGTGSAGKVRVVIVDDHEMVRQMLENVFATLPAYHVISQACNGLEAVRVCLKLKPDLVLLDAAMPEFSGLDTLKDLSTKLPKTRFLVVSGSENAGLPIRFVQAGAHGYVGKTEPLKVLLEAIQTVASGGNYYRSKQKDLLLQALTAPKRDEVLTAREKQVLQLISEGYLTKEIAGKLGVSFKTAETHRTNLMRKLGLHDVASLTRYVLEGDISE